MEVSETFDFSVDIALLGGEQLGHPIGDVPDSASLLSIHIQQHTILHGSTGAISLL